MKTVLMILLLTATSAYAEIYRWTDSRGTDHFTNSVYEIPERYRAKAKTVNLGIPEPKSEQSQGASPAAQAPAPPLTSSPPPQSSPVAVSPKPAMTVVRHQSGNRKARSPRNRSEEE